MTKTVFFGSSEYSTIVLDQLLKLPDFPVALVVTKTDKPVGRDQKIVPNPVAKFAIDHHLPLLQIEEFTPKVKATLRQKISCPLSSRGAAGGLAFGLCVAFGPPFFDQETIDIFPNKIVNIHPSPLPKYRGATPGPWQIINGESKSAVTFFQIDLLPDHGPLIAQVPFSIDPRGTSADFYHQAFTTAANNLKNVLISYLKHPQKLIPQDHLQKSYYPKLTKDTAKVDWSWPEDKIYRFILAMNPWPIAWTFVENQHGSLLKMKIFSSKIDHDLKLETVQLEGKNKVNWSEISPYYQLVK